MMLPRRFPISASTLFLGLAVSTALAGQTRTLNGPASREPRVVVSTYVGLADHPGKQDGDRGQARLDDPHGVVVGSDGTLYISEAGNQLIRAVKPDGTVSTLAGSADQADGVDGLGG